MVSDYLGEAGLRVTIAGTGEAGLAVLAREPFDVVVLDLMLPGIDGLEVCRRLRAYAGMKFDLPVLMLTARGDSADRVVGLELGADDYLPKPFEPRELLARLRAILRRGRTRNPDVLRFGPMEIDRASRELRVNGEVRAITSYQFALLVAMAENAGRVLTREQLMDQVKGAPLEAFGRCGWRTSAGWWRACRMAASMRRMACLPCLRCWHWPSALALIRWCAGSHGGWSACKRAWRRSVPARFPRGLQLKATTKSRALLRVSIARRCVSKN